MIFQNFFLKRKIQTLLKEAPQRKPHFCSLYEADDILIVFNIKDREEVLRCVERLKSSEKEIHLCAFLPKRKNKKKATYDTDPSWLLVDEDASDAQGLPQEATCQAFFDLPADLLIDLTRPEDYMMHYLELKHSSSFKVGNKSILRSFFDMTVTMKDGDDIAQYFEYILFYLQTIRSK
ncbi:MAG: hypothetical protein LBL81_00620 [Tannerella sp.]|jgi:hypothetical protein|nr:hypothetical protein [Tannerella sp.]